MQAQKKSFVSEFLSEELGKSKRTVDDVASAAGMSAKELTMIVRGQLKLPINKADSLAKALGIETIHLLRLILEDALPDYWALIQDRLDELAITQAEIDVVEGYRRLSAGRNIAVFMFPATGPYVEVVPS